MRLLLASFLVLASSPVAAVEISNFKSGLVCNAGKPGRDVVDWICQQTQDIPVTDQGRCVYDGVTRPCTWHGFEFDYSAKEPGTKLQCVAETSEPIANGNPREILAREATSHPFELELEGKTGHFINPMYHVFHVKPSGSAPLAETITCKAGDAVLFQAKFNIHFPQADR